VPQKFQQGAVPAGCPLSGSERKVAFFYGIRGCVYRTAARGSGGDIKSDKKCYTLCFFNFNNAAAY